MEIGNRIRTMRMQLNLSQEELAEKIYVSRQTISNWENDKSYPDINSLLRLSEVFALSLDHLIKGDVQQMKEKIEQKDIRKLKKHGNIYAVLVAITLISLPILMHFLKFLGFIIWIPIWLLCLYNGYKMEKLKNQLDIHTYKEIVDFLDGKRLDEIQKAKESGKLPYQQAMLIIISALIGVLITYSSIQLL